MENNLRRAGYMKPSIGIHAGISAERFHHSLTVGFRVIFMFQNHIALIHYLIHIPVSILC